MTGLLRRIAAPAILALALPLSAAGQPPAPGGRPHGSILVCAHFAGAALAQIDSPARRMDGSSSGLAPVSGAAHDSPSFYERYGRVLWGAGAVVMLFAVGVSTLASLLARQRRVQVTLRASQQALLDSEERYRLLVNNASEAICVIQQGVIRFANPMFARFSGMEVNKAIGSPVGDLVVAEDNEKARQHHESVLRGEPQSGPVEYRARHTGGGFRWISVSSVRILWEGQPATLNFASDVTERKRAEAAIQQSEALMRGLFDNMASGATICRVVGDGSKSSDYVIQNANQAALRIEGLAAGQATGKTLKDLRPDAADDGLIRSLQSVWRTGQPASFPARVIGHGKPPAWHEYHVFRVPTGDIVVIYDDVTERRRAEESLRESEERFRLLAENMPVLVNAVTKGYIITFWNRACEEATGYSAAEIVNNPRAKEMLYPDPAYRRKLAREWAASGGVVKQREATLSCKDGSTRVISWTSAFPEPGRRPVSWAVGVDITDRLRVEKQRLEMERQLLHSQKLESLGVMAGGIAHDFNNLLMAVLGNLDFALQDMPGQAPAVRSVREAVAAARRAADITRQMLAYSGRAAASVQEVELSRIVTENADMLRSAVSRTGSFAFELDDRVPPVLADPGQVQQVITNLVTNASEALRDGPGRVTVATGSGFCGAADLARSRTHEKPAPGLYAWVEVRDTGCGMDAHTLQRVFDPFFTTKFTGRGLGMSTVLGIVRAHGGAIFVDSAPGAGSRVRVLFPVPNRPAAQPAPASAPASPSPSPSLSVLVADDEDFLLKLYSKALSALGLNVLTASDGLQALNIFRQKPREIAAVILDLTMPNMDGAAALKELRRIQPDVPVILTSGYSQDEAARRVNASDVTCFLQKPCALDRLKEAVRKAIGATPPPTSPGRPG